MKRRDFFRTLAASSAAAVAAPGLAVAAPASSRVGLLLPSNLELAAHFLRGWQGAGTQAAAQLERVGGHAAAAKAVQGWLERGSVDLIVSALSAHGPQTRALLEARGVPMLVSDYGANWARSHSALVLRQGLRMAEGAFALGQQAARTGSHTATIVTDSFDAGFDHLGAFQLGFESAGGRVLEHLILDSSAVAWDADRLAQLRPDAVYVSASTAQSLQRLHLPAGVRVLAGGLAPWLLRGVRLETALALAGADHPMVQLGARAAETVRASFALTNSGLHLLPALLQARQSPELQRLEMHGGRVVARHALSEAPTFSAELQRLQAARSSGYTNAYPQW